MWDDLRQEFVAMDPYGTGFVNADEFRDVLTELVVQLTDYEQEALVRKFDLKKDGRYVYRVRYTKMDGLNLYIVFN